MSAVWWVATRGCSCIINKKCAREPSSTGSLLAWLCVGSCTSHNTHTRTYINPYIHYMHAHVHLFVCLACVFLREFCFIVLNHTLLDNWAVVCRETWSGGLYRWNPASVWTFLIVFFFLLFFTPPPTFSFAYFFCSHQLEFQSRNDAYRDTFATRGAGLLDGHPTQTELARLVNPCRFRHTRLCWHCGIPLEVGESAFFGPTFSLACMLVVTEWHLCKTCIISWLNRWVDFQTCASLWSWLRSLHNSSRIFFSVVAIQSRLPSSSVPL